MSDKYLKYKSKLKKHKLFIMVMQLLLIASFIIIWQLMADKEVINTFITSSPKRIIECIIKLYSTDELFKHILITTMETIISFALGTLIGLIIASILWWNKTIAEIIDPYLTIINSLPKVALGPLIIIWLGADIKSIILMALLISVIVAIINIYDGFEKTDKLKINMLKSFGANKKDIYMKLVLPGNISTIMNVIKVNISMSLIGVIMGEFLVSKHGIGYLITYGSQIFNLDLVMTGIILLCILAAIMYYGINTITKIIIKK